MEIKLDLSKEYAIALKAAVRKVLMKLVSGRPLRK